MEEEIQKDHALGAVISPPDNRRIPLAAVQAPVVRPKVYHADDDDITLENQGQIGTCMGEAEGGEVEYREKRDTGKVIHISKLRLYNRFKRQDGQPNQQGSAPNIAAPIKVAEGAPVGTDDRNLSHEQIVAMPDYTPAERDEAGLHVAAGYAWLPNDLEQILQAIFQNGTYPVTVEVGDWSKLPVKPSPLRGYHRIRLNGYEELPNGDAKIWFRNSWGKGWAQTFSPDEKSRMEHGNGYFLWSDYKLHIYDLLVYTDIPMDVILKARATPFIFTSVLKKGSTGSEVTELQKRLAKEIAIDGKPCFPAGVAFTATFGPTTELAVQRYQFVKKIVTFGTPETTGYGQVGPATRASLNGTERKRLYPAVDRLKAELVAIMAAIGQPIAVTADWRTFAEQDALYAIGRTLPGKIVTNAKGGDSFHNWRCAFDVAFSTASGISYDGPWAMLAAIGKIIGLEWGGDWATFPDKPHFQLTMGYTLDDFKSGKVDETKFS